MANPEQHKQQRQTTAREPLVELPASAHSPLSSDKQMASPSYRLPILDQDFLLSDSQRGMRFMLEYEKTEEIMRAWNIMSTVVVFGSARVREDGPGRQPFWYHEARRFARLCSAHGTSPDPVTGERHNVICTGGGPGIMEAANRGAFEVGAPSIGLNITLPHEQCPNPYMTPELTMNFHYFAMRKMHFAMRACAIVAFPGGFGTFDELFELLTLSQTGKSTKSRFVLFDKAYWSSVVNFDVLVSNGMISKTDLDMIHYAETAEQAWEMIGNDQIRKRAETDHKSV